jgi:HD-GYP domain-containing protein (c-di-GMP phosphodiesterase class II)
MKAHADIGSRMLAAIPALEMDQVVAAVRHHHEGFDGKGYPDGLAGESIPFLSRIISLADGYDAMATARPYHKPREHAAIMDVMYGENAAHYDPWMLRNFTRLIETSSHHAGRHSGDQQSAS